MDPNVAFNMTQYLYSGQILQGISLYYIDVVGPFFAIVVSSGLGFTLYRRYQSIEAVAAIYILVGYVLADYLPAQALSTGRILMILGVAIWLFKLWLGVGDRR